MAGGRHPDDKSGETDAKLHVERERANDELLERSSRLGEDADDVIRSARERARAILAIARRREDQSLAASSAGSDVTTAVASERAQADEALEHEHVTADAALSDERACRLRALLQLLATERYETDHALAVERKAFGRLLSVRDDVLAGVGHDLRGHLTMLMLNASVITLRSGERDIVTLANGILRATAQMEGLLADLLDAATMESGALVILPAPTDIVSVVRTAIELSGPAAEASSVELAFDAPPPIELQLDAPRLTRVLMNLLGNAIKFTPEGSRVTVSVKRVGREVEVMVADTGPGIPADQLETIFQKFRRTETASRKAGYGLGLYIARAIVVAHGGRIWAENNAHEGATFLFRLPAA